MTTSNTKIVQIADNKEKKVLSKAQKQFNNLIKKIESQKKLLLEWQDTVPNYHQHVDKEYEPLLNSFNDHRIEWLHLLDSAYDNKDFKKTDKNKIKDIVGDLIHELVFEQGKEELKELYNKYTDDGDFDTDKEMMASATEGMMKSMLQGFFNIDLNDDDIDFSSPEKMQAHLKEKLLEKEQQQRQQEEKKTSRKKTPKQLEKEAQQKKEQENISKSIQEVYRKLAATIHPDREPDEEERERKTRLMQKVNAAYAKKDLLQLLELQLEIEQIDQSHLNNITEDRLKHFNKILQEQCDELSQEIEQFSYPFKMQLNIPPFINLHPKDLMKELNEDIKELKNRIKLLKTDISRAKNPTTLKAWLKSYRIQKSKDYDDDFFF